MSNLQKHQLLPPITFPDDLDPSTAKAMRLIYAGVGKAFQDSMRLIDTDPRMSDTRVAHALRMMQGGKTGNVELDTASQPNDGDVLYATDGGRRGVWGQSGAPDPTDPGTGPAVGAPPHPLLDGDQNNDTLAGTPVRGDVIAANATPAWARVAKPSVRSAFIHDATDPGWVATPTRKRWLHSADWMADGATAAVGAIRGTAPNSYHTWEFPVANPSTIVTNWQIPDDWRTGAITFAVWWLTAAATATNWIPTLTYKERVDGDDYSAAGTAITPAAVSANFANHIVKKATLGTFTPPTLAEQVRLALSRTPGGSDTCLGSIYIVGVEAAYTPLF